MCRNKECTYSTLPEMVSMYQWDQYSQILLVTKSKTVFLILGIMSLKLILCHCSYSTLYGKWNIGLLNPAMQWAILSTGLIFVFAIEIKLFAARISLHNILHAHAKKNKKSLSEPQICHCELRIEAQIYHHVQTVLNNCYLFCNPCSLKTLERNWLYFHYSGVSSLILIFNATSINTNQSKMWT